MLFLGPLYDFLASHLQGQINHWPLVRLIVYSTDKTIFYLLLLLVLRVLWLKFRHRPLHWRPLLHWSLLTGYVIMLLMLTVFRDVYFPWELRFYPNRPLSDINFNPFIETIKLARGSWVDFWYQSVGNVLWFLPLGFGLPWATSGKHRFWSVLLTGILVSFTIEALQFVLYTGVADIDDIIFNGIGAALGYGFYRMTHLKQQN